VKDLVKKSIVASKLVNGASVKPVSRSSVMDQWVKTSALRNQGGDEDSDAEDDVSAEQCCLLVRILSIGSFCFV
jgi:hypothetical protein